MKSSSAITMVLIASVCLTGLPTLAQESDTKNDPSLTPWNDPDDPYVIRLNRKDASIDKWNQRNEKLDPDRLIQSWPRVSVTVRPH